jgi:hypothetical protein
MRNDLPIARALYLFNPPVTRLLLRAQRFPILRSITVHQATLCTMHVRLFCGHRKAGKQHIFSSFPVSKTAERRIVLDCGVDIHFV